MFGVGRRYLGRELRERIHVNEGVKLTEGVCAGEGVNEER